MTTESVCNGTYSDLLFYCIFLVAPITAILCYFIFRRAVYNDVRILYTTRGAPVEAQVLSKECSYDTGYTLSSDTEQEEVQVRPFYLYLQYTPIGCNDANSTITKKLQVSEEWFQSTAIGNSVQLVQIEGCHASAIHLQDLTTQIDLDFTTIVLCTLIWLLTIGFCAMDSCVVFGWEIVALVVGGAASLAWIYLNHVSNCREKLCEPLLEAKEEQAGLLGIPRI